MEKPTALEPDAIAAFKEQLGIHSSEDAQFAWIAEVGLQSPLPPRWTSHEDPDSSFIYYVDHDRQTSSWENPLVPHLRHVVEIGRSYLKNPTENFFEEQKGVLWHQHKHQLDCWQGPFTDDEGRKYFINPSEQVSSWQDPRVDAQYIFELESGLLTSLEEILPAASPNPENQFWRTPTGAEVLTLDASGPLGATRTKAAWRSRGEGQLREMALEKVKELQGRLKGIQQDEEEAQRLAFAKKVEERRRRRNAGAGAPAQQEQPDAPMVSTGSHNRHPCGPPPSPKRHLQAQQPPRRQPSGEAAGEPPEQAGAG